MMFKLILKAIAILAVVAMSAVVFLFTILVGVVLYAIDKLKGQR